MLPIGRPVRKAIRNCLHMAKRVHIELVRLALILRHGNRRKVGPLRGAFSAYELLRSKQVHGRIVLESQKCPDTVQGTIREISKLGQNGFQPWPVFWTHHPRAHLVGPTLLLLNSQNQGCMEGAYQKLCFPSDPACLYPFHPPETYLAGNWTSLLSRWKIHGYYHCLHDILPRLAVLEEFPDDTQILVPAKIPQFATEFLDLLGLTNRIRRTSETNLIVENFYFSSPTAMTGCYNPYAVEFLRKSLLPKGYYAKPEARRFYITRRNKTRGILNERELTSFFESKGWSVIDLETLSVSEQIGLFAQAEAICGFHGAAFSNLVWCRPGCKVLELFSSTFLNGCYEIVAELTQCHYQFEIFQGDKMDQITVPLSKIKNIVSAWN